MKLKKYGGVTLVVIGMALLFPLSITGAVVGVSIKTLGSIFGILLLIGGLTFILSDLEGKIDLYTKKTGKGEEYHLIDPTLTLGGADLSLEEFKRGVDEIRSDPELIGLVRSTYLRPLENLMGTEKEELAKEFLEILGIKQDVEDKYSLNKEEKNRIKAAFDEGYTIKPNRRQLNILKKYGIRFEPGGKHPRLILGSKYITSSSTPSEYRTGRNFSHQLIKFIEENYSPE